MRKEEQAAASTGNSKRRNEYKIESLLPVGQENAITTAELLRLTDCGSVRELRRQVELERNAGAVICSGSRKGYWRPKDRQEAMSFIKTMEAKAFSTLAATKSARRSLNVPEGQQEFKEVETDEE